MGEVQLQVKNRVANIEFYHPAHNSLPGDLLRKLQSDIESCSINKAVDLIHISSKGDRSFCAGASFTELASIQNQKEGKSFFLGFANVINAIRKSSKIVIMSIQGKAVGGGVGLAAAADYCIATKWASVRLSELAVGIGPFVIGPAVERKIGASAFSQMSLSPEEWQTAEWSKQKGLYHQVFDSKEIMENYKDEFITKLLSYNPQALSHLKSIFWAGTDHWETLLEERAAISGELVLSEAAKKAIHGFLNNS